MYVLSKKIEKKKIKNFPMKFLFFLLKNLCILHGQVFVMFYFLTVLELHTGSCENKMTVITTPEHDSESYCIKRWVRNIIIDEVEALTR